MSVLERLTQNVIDTAGGRKRARAMLLYTAVLGLNGADAGAVGAMAMPLQHAFAIGKTDLGLLLTASLGAGAAATLPFGWLVDRTSRVRLLTLVVAAWGAGMILSGIATSFGFLLTTRLCLGAASACATPAIASLIGDEFDPDHRGRIYGHVLSGELIGTALGFLLAGELASWTWRAGFIALSIPAAALAWMLRGQPEPSRRRDGDEEGGGDRRISQLIEQRHIEPHDALVLREGQAKSSLWWAVRYILRIRTNVLLIAASALAYFYFMGVRAFGVEYLHVRYDLSHPMAVLLLVVIGTGALAGVLAGGRVADRLIAGGRLNARVLVPAVAYFVAVGGFVVALLTTSVWAGALLLAVAADALGAISPPLDAARLDIVPPGLWGRAESVRTCLRRTGEAAAPLTFGYLAEHVFGGGSRVSGLHSTFLLMVVVFAAGGVVALFALRTYERDVATANASA